MTKVRWGVLGVARIAVTKVIPAMQRGDLCEITGIASRDLSRARDAAQKLGIRKPYGSYDEMLADPEIEAIYNPLPNHMHVPWSIRAAKAGKHVLCEKPIGMNAGEALDLIAARDREGVVMGEAFMFVVHPQWVRTKELIRSGAIGSLRYIAGTFSYFKLEPDNIRNIREYGGGGLMDIGCYPIKCSRWIFEEEPARISASIVRYPNFGADILTSAVLEYPSGHCVFSCSTQAAPCQSMLFCGTEGRIEVEIPWNAPPMETTRIQVYDSRGMRVEEFPPCDQYTIQGDLFSRAIRERTPPAVTLEDARRTMQVIDAVLRAADRSPATLSSGEGAG